MQRMTAGRRDDHEHAAAAATLTIGSRVGALVAESARSLLLGQFWRRAWRCDCGERFVGTELRAFRELACPACVRRAEANVAAATPEERWAVFVLRRRARAAVKQAIDAGLLVRPAHCAFCGSDRREIEAHHRDYSEPLAVIWCCRRCHTADHMRMRRQPTPTNGDPTPAQQTAEPDAAE